MLEILPIFNYSTIFIKKSHFSQKTKSIQAALPLRNKAKELGMNTDHSPQSSSKCPTIKGALQPVTGGHWAS